MTPEYEDLGSNYAIPCSPTRLLHGLLGKTLPSRASKGVSLCPRMERTAAPGAPGVSHALIIMRCRCRTQAEEEAEAAKQRAEEAMRKQKEDMEKMNQQMEEMKRQQVGNTPPALCKLPLLTRQWLMLGGSIAALKRNFQRVA